ncbi:hypothetical protein VHEMI08905 [[Torrubiella] hemipterigena]|uniref:Uncharacterized protein n=1 Tax=[Torrubiella] hemipterigena TaxID=1531966 RepID=A0A0A1TEY6_9HYPO|nr:hypothetical protein VHEMI08905 [[Torrubiella] hemipterigena]
MHTGFEDTPGPGTHTGLPTLPPLPTPSGFSRTSVFCADLNYDRPFFASVIRANPTATEYAIECGGGNGMCAVYNTSMHVLTVGPSTMVATAMDTYVTRGFDCKLHGTTAADCEFFVHGEAPYVSGTFPMPIPDKDEIDPRYNAFSDYVVPMYITAGLEKLAPGYSESSATSTSAPKSTGDASVVQTTSQTPPASSTQAKSAAAKGSVKSVLVALGVVASLAVL